MEFNDALRYARTTAGWSQRRMAEEIKVPLRTIENWEGGQRSCPAYVERLVLAEVIRVSGHSELVCLLSAYK